MQRRMILRRHRCVNHEIERRLRRAVDIDAAAAHLLERGADRLVTRDHLRARDRLEGYAAAPPAAHRPQAAPSSALQAPAPACRDRRPASPPACARNARQVFAAARRAAAA